MANLNQLITREAHLEPIQAEDHSALRGGFALGKARWHRPGTVGAHRCGGMRRWEVAGEL